MLSRTLYETLPFGYLTLGGSSMVLFEQSIALLSSFILFWAGARIYNLRSNNRRTDNKRRRKAGKLPPIIYDSLPFLYLFSALVFFKLGTHHVVTVSAIALLSYSLYVFIRRSSNRRHKIPTSAW